MSDVNKGPHKKRILRLLSQDEMEDVFEIGVGHEEIHSTGRDLAHTQWSHPGLSDELSENKDGDFFGVGPKGYKRSDERIFEDICEELTSHHEIDASDIVVKVQKGEVLLSGRVQRERLKTMVETLVLSTPGVTKIHNELYVTKETNLRDHGPRAVTKKDLGLS